MKCRMCNSLDVQKFLDLGHIPVVDKFLTNDELKKSEIIYPLNVYLCRNCGLSQLGYIIPANKLFNEQYAYESGTTKKRQKNHDELASSACKNFNLDKNSFVVDIGSNVGILLECFEKYGIQVLGIDASANVVKMANSKNIETWLGFFDDKIAEKILKEKQPADVVTATNVFAHIQDYDSFMKNLNKILSKKGVFIFQVPHFLKLIKNLEYDTIYHEHISYFGLKPLIRFFNKYDYELFDVLETDIDGGSIRCFVSKKNNYRISKNIKHILKLEEKEKIYSLKRLYKFQHSVNEQKKLLRSLLIDLKKRGKRIAAVGAPAKGIVLLNFCKIDNGLLDFISEKSSLKIGKYTPGIHIPVLSDAELIKNKPDYALLLSWNFADEIIKNLSRYSKKGGKFIIPIPKPKIIHTKK